jgi:hypothetical protein
MVLDPFHIPDRNAAHHGGYKQDKGETQGDFFANGEVFQGVDFVGLQIFNISVITQPHSRP